MPILIGAARIDERGKDYGGQDGDQTGHEVEAYLWTDRGGDGWNVLRYKDQEKRSRAVEYAWEIIKNPYIGYNQHRHTTMLKEARKVNYKFDKITTPCATDCCQMQVAIAEALGINVPSCYTATQVKAFMSTGAFEHITGPKYAHTDNYLLAGDIGCMPPGVQGHTWIALENGPLAHHDTEMLYVVNCRSLRQRTAPSLNSDTIQYLPKDSAFNVISYAEDADGDNIEWAQGEYKGRYGYCSMKYLTPAVKLPELYTTGNTRLRNGVGKEYDTLVYIPAGQTFTGTGLQTRASDGTVWYEAIYNNVRGWVSSKYLIVK